MCFFHIWINHSFRMDQTFSKQIDVDSHFRNHRGRFIIAKAWSTCTKQFRSKRQFRKDLSTAHLYSKKKKFQFERKTLSIINNWYLNLRYLSFLNTNDMKCSCSIPTMRCTLECVNTKLMGKFVRVALINWILEYELHEGHSSNFT